MKLDPNNNDAMSSVGDDMGDGPCKYSGTVVGVDGCAYGIVPFQCNRIVKYDPINDITTSYVGRITKKIHIERLGIWGLERDGYIYAITTCDSRELKIDIINNTHCFIKNESI